MLNLEWLRTFKMVFEKGSMTAAAEALFISQPGVSLHLGSLESYVGHKLFERRSRRLEPTERGKLLYGAVVDAIGRLEEVEKTFQRSTREDRVTVTVGMCFETFREAIERHVPALDFDLILEFGEYRELLRKLSQGIVDLVVTPHRVETAGAMFRPFSQENIVLVAGRHVDDEGFVTARDEGPEALLPWLEAQRWYGVTGDNEHLTRFWQLNFRRRPSFRPNFIVPNFHSIIASLTRGPGLGVIPDFLARRELERGELVILWSGYRPLRNTLYFARRRDAPHPEPLDRLEGLLQDELPAQEE